MGAGLNVSVPAMSLHPDWIMNLLLVCFNMPTVCLPLSYNIIVPKPAVGDTEPYIVPSLVSLKVEGGTNIPF